MIIYVDIDDTIAKYTDENKGQYDKAEPIPERIKIINELYDEDNTIVYWTARGTMSGINWFKITYDQLIRWGCKFHELRMNKPVYDIFIDDKNINSNRFFEDLSS